MTELDDRPPAGEDVRTPVMGVRHLGDMPLPSYRGESATARRRVAPRRSGWLGLVLPAGWRWAHEMYAALAGRFWIYCPLCLKGFGGHEWGDVYTLEGERLPGTIPTGDPFTGRMGEAGAAICQACTVRRLGAAAWSGYPPAPAPAPAPVVEGGVVDDHRRPLYVDHDDPYDDDEVPGYLT